MTLQLGLFDPPELTELISSVPDTLASHSAIQGTEKAKMMIATSGLKCFGLSETSGPASYFLKTFLATFPSDLTPYSWNWKPKRTKSANRLYFQLQRSERRTKGTGSLSRPSGETTMWRTPQGANGSQGAKSAEFYEHCLETGQSMITLVDQVANSSTSSSTEPCTNMWATPQARDYRSPDSPDSPRLARKMEQGWSLNLNDQVRHWPTPRANDAEKRGNIAQDVRNGLPAAIKMWPTPQSADDRDRGDLSMPCIQRRVELGKQLMLTMVAKEPGQTGQLNPEWVECLMGFPMGWTDIGGLLDPDYRSTTGSRPEWWPD